MVYDFVVQPATQYADWLILLVRLLSLVPIVPALAITGRAIWRMHYQAAGAQTWGLVAIAWILGLGLYASPWWHWFLRQ